MLSSGGEGRRTVAELMVFDSDKTVHSWWGWYWEHGERGSVGGYSRHYREIRAHVVCTRCNHLPVGQRYNVRQQTASKSVSITIVCLKMCRTHQHYCRQWLPNTEWSDSARRDRWLWKDKRKRKRKVLRWEWKGHFTWMVGDKVCDTGRFLPIHGHVLAVCVPSHQFIWGLTPRKFVFRSVHFHCRKHFTSIAACF